MHPNRGFDWAGETDMLAFAAARGFAHIFVAGDGGLFVAHAPLLVTPAGRIQFHLARRNRAAGQFPGQAVLISVSARDGYHSANWYASADQVPTWHYEAVEIEGAARAIDEPELVAHLDQLSETMEGHYSPERPWTRAKMGPGKFEAMVQALIGFEVAPTAIRGTRKFNQHKRPPDLDATIAGQSGAGREDIVAAIRDVTGRA